MCFSCSKNCGSTTDVIIPRNGHKKETNIFPQTSTALCFSLYNRAESNFRGYIGFVFFFHTQPQKNIKF